MAWWQYALVAFAIAWVIQAYGVWRQTRHYQSVFSELRRSFADGALGVGAAPAKFGKGAIAIVVVDPQRNVRAVRVMQGRSVFAKFDARPQFVGVGAAELAATLERPGVERPLAAALGQALAQIDKISNGAQSVVEPRLVSA